MNDGTDIPEQECLTCHYKMDRTSTVDNGGRRQEPIKDDLSVCLKCGTVTKFDEKLNMVALTAAELKDLRREHASVYLRLKKIQAVIQAMAKQN